jgi:hypothetical protein
MFEPHLGMNDPSSGDNKSFNEDPSAKDLLAELDRIAPIKAFDAFPKVGLGNVFQDSGRGLHIACLSNDCVGPVDVYGEVETGWVVDGHRRRDHLSPHPREFPPTCKLARRQLI